MRSNHFHTSGATERAALHIIGKTLAGHRSCWNVCTQYCHKMESLCPVPCIYVCSPTRGGGVGERCEKSDTLLFYSKMAGGKLNRVQHHFSMVRARVCVRQKIAFIIPLRCIVRRIFMGLFRVFCKRICRSPSWIISETVKKKSASFATLSKSEKQPIHYKKLLDIRSNYRSLYCFNEYINKAH